MARPLVLRPGNHKWCPPDPTYVERAIQPAKPAFSRLDPLKAGPRAGCPLHGQWGPLHKSFKALYGYFVDTSPALWREHPGRWPRGKALG
jgi:hypothetical protein